MAGRFDKARLPYLFRFGHCVRMTAGAENLADPHENCALRQSRIGENQETSERLTQTNVAAALDGLGGNSHVRDVELFRRAGGGLMARQLYLRIASALGFVALA